jgi:FlaA1/EpsC-like NDP-sugar epimerase
MSKTIDTILPAILGREDSFLKADIEAKRAEITSTLVGKRVLVIGAAGSIGAAFSRVLAEYSIGTLHLIDISENNLAELVRDFRSSGTNLPEDFQTFAIDFSGSEMRALLQMQAYDYVLNFAALKHVRSERDPLTLMRLLKVNVLANDQLIQSLLGTNPPTRVFAVSSDKAVRSANLMGGSKAFMERVFLSRADELPFGSARFANVAFSDGSLLFSFLRRLELRQPISAPNDVRRYFITHREAGELCLLGAFTGGNREIVFPKFRPESDMMTFAEIARVFLRAHGYEPHECDSEEEARARALELTSSSKEWPCWFTGSDTTGEKAFEEFSHPDETVDLARFEQVGIVTKPRYDGAEVVRTAIDHVLKIRDSGRWDKAELLEAVRLAVPELDHVEHGRNLDQKM